jgi:hypothetical protein
MQYVAYIIFVMVVYRIVFYYRKHRTYYKVKATVTGNEKQTVEDPLTGEKYYYYPILRFTDKAGTLHEVISTEDNADRPAYSIGQQLTVLVHPADARRVILINWVDVYALPILWLAVGLFLWLVPFLNEE